MSHRELALADAIVTAINAGSYSQTVAAFRCHWEELPLETETGLLVAVLPGPGEESPATFDGAWLDDVKIDVEVRQKTSDATNATNDPLALLAEQVFDAVKAARYSQCVFQKSEKSPPVDPDKLREKQLFGTGATFHFQLVT